MFILYSNCIFLSYLIFPWLVHLIQPFLTDQLINSVKKQIFFEHLFFMEEEPYSSVSLLLFHPTTSKIIHLNIGYACGILRSVFPKTAENNILPQPLYTIKF